LNKYEDFLKNYCYCYFFFVFSTLIKHHQSLSQFSEENFKENIARLSNCNEKERINCFYLVDRKIFGIKAIITPGASPLLVFNMFQFELIECLYLSKNLEEINMLPGLIKNAIQLYKENIARDRTIYLKFYSAYTDFSTRQQAKCNAPNRFACNN
jgi:hypothetical protein